MTDPNIIVIHDDWNERHPVIIELKEKYGDENVKFINESQKGIDFLLNIPPRKTIVLLDYNFKTGEPSGGDVFRKIREKSSLVYVIIITKSQTKDIRADDMLQFVNNHALAIANPNDGYVDLIKLVDTAKHQLDMRADILIEEWISKKGSEDLDKPYLRLTDGNVYSLNEILSNIRMQTDLGKQIEANILGLSIDLVMNKFSK